MDAWARGEDVRYRTEISVFFCVQHDKFSAGRYTTRAFYAGQKIMGTDGHGG
jgi:hypothetical protein